MKPYNAYGKINPEFNLIEYFNPGADRPWRIIESDRHSTAQRKRYHNIVNSNYTIVATANAVKGGLKQLHDLKAKFE